jgi:kynureninase
VALPQFEITAEFAASMDGSDPIARFRNEFYLPRAWEGSNAIYLCGHSLGLQPKRVREYVEQELKDWQDLGVEGHFRGKHPWMPYHRLLTDQTARLVGAQAVEVVAMNSLTVNLHLMMVSFFRPTAQRHRILIEGGAFPSDQYAVKSHLRTLGYHPETSLAELSPRQGETTLREEDILGLIEREGHLMALIMLSGVNYRTGQAFDMASIAAAGHRKGCIVGFDLAHAAGNLLLKLHDWNVDFAVWCSYKYLNGGPGCVAGCYVHERYADNARLPRFAGWWGHDEKTRFQMGADFHPMPGAEGWQLSNPSILSMAALRASMDIFDEAGMEGLREKSVRLTGYLEWLLDQNSSSKFTILTPRERERRGAQLSLRVANHGRALCRRLANEGVICDWREPDILRVAPVPLYNTYTDVYRFVEKFLAALE